MSMAIFNSKLLNYQRVNPINHHSSQLTMINHYQRVNPINIPLNHYKNPLNHYKSLSKSLFLMPGDLGRTHLGHLALAETNQEIRIRHSGPAKISVALWPWGQLMVGVSIMI